eukprot:TRINITY_DN35277_c0_g1_i1.p1 TRINITY_DN35277_c0_g1~~TRINITY_DN35277_c0_g1_i1.p1  ORF type:complete len:573 (-),score=90.30 TRINITY_DN35277_c0_g1_i1:44-1762(-)
MAVAAVRFAAVVYAIVAQRCVALPARPDRSRVRSQLLDGCNGRVVPGPFASSVGVGRGLSKARWRDVLLWSAIQGGCVAPKSCVRGEHNGSFISHSPAVLESLFVNVHKIGRQFASRCVLGWLVLSIGYLQTVNVVTNPPDLNEPPMMLPELDRFLRHGPVKQAFQSALSTESALFTRTARFVLSTLAELERAVGSGNSDDLAAEMFTLSSLDPAQVRYIVAFPHMETLVHASPPIYEMAAPQMLAAQENGARSAVRREALVFDLGMSGGMDSLVYLQHNWRVVAVEANPRLVAWAESSLDEYVRSGQLQIMHAAVTTTKRRVRTEEVEFCMALRIEQGKVQDSLGTSGAQRCHDEGGNVAKVRRVTCPALVETFGVPFYVKVDIEGGEGLDCLEDLSLRPETRPTISSVEVQHFLELPTNSTAVVPARGPLRRKFFELMQRHAPHVAEIPLDKLSKAGVRFLARVRFVASALTILHDMMGYRRFKLVRQSIYHMRFGMKAWDAKLWGQSTKGTFAIEQLESQGASGPFGDVAVDWRSGRRWRDAEDIAHDLLTTALRLEDRSEWFDIHATI